MSTIWEPPQLGHNDVLEMAFLFLENPLIDAVRTLVSYFY
jgi:hypothetical protein